MSNPLPAREEAWNCNRCRDTGRLIALGIVSVCDRCQGRWADVGSLPLPEEMQTDVGGAGAGSVGGPSHDTDRWAHENAWCRGGPDCLCEPEGL